MSVNKNMTKLIPYFKNQEFAGLAEDIAIAFREFISNEKENRIKFKFYLARTILDSESYKKFSHENSDFIARLVSRIKMELKNKDLPALSRTSVFDAIQVFSKFKSLEELEKELGAFYNWSDCLRLVGRERAQELDSGCWHCPIKGHCSGAS